MHTLNRQGQPLYFVVVSLQSQLANTHLQEQDTTLTAELPVSVQPVKVACAELPLMYTAPPWTIKIQTQNTQGQPLYIVVVSLKSQLANTHLQEQDTALTD